MFSIAELLHYGTPWWVYWTDTSGTKELVQPQTATQGPRDIGSTDFSSYRIVLLGFQYTIRADAASDGFRLYWKEDAGAGTERDIYVSRVDTATTITGGGSVFVPGPAGSISSPLAVVQPASLWIEAYSQMSPGSSILLWGIHTDSDFRCAKSYTGSPIDF